MAKKKALSYPKAKAQADVILKKAINSAKFNGFSDEYNSYPDVSFKNTLYFESDKYKIIVIEKESLTPFPYD